MASPFADFATSEYTGAQALITGFNKPETTAAVRTGFDELNAYFKEKAAAAAADDPIAAALQQDLPIDDTTANKDKWWRDLPDNGRTPPPSPIDYSDSPLAKRYGMDAATAYQEALANTSHQREVRDLMAAGLNPVLGIKGSGADGVGSAASLTSARSTSGGGGSSSSADGSGGLLRFLVPVIAGAAVGFASKNAYAGTSAAKTMSDILKNAFK